jgi:hypothetical protein
MLTKVRSFLREYADFDYPTQSREAVEFRTAISPNALSRFEDLTVPALQRHVVCGLILCRWQYMYGRISRKAVYSSFTEDYLRILFWDGRAWTASISRDLLDIAGPCARDCGPSIAGKFGS